MPNSDEKNPKAKENVQPESGLSETLNLVTKAFFSDPKLNMLVNVPLLLYPGMSTIHLLNSEPSRPQGDDAEVLNRIITSYLPAELNFDSVVQTKSITNLRKLALLVKMASDLGRKAGNLADLLNMTAAELEQLHLGPLVSTEEMYRLRAFSTDASVQDYSPTILKNNPNLNLDPAYNVFISSIKLGKSLSDIGMILEQRYGSEHTEVGIEMFSDGRRKTDYGLNKGVDDAAETKT